MSSSSSESSPSSARGAVFLSYAREDTEAARRIADALRAFGVEVWFDQSELRGGDQWDGKIKKQIRECALFLPLVSKQTQERTEGYFRREWLLAVERTRDMAAGVAFIVPVVIDDTREADAAVPEEFMRFHWTRLAHGVPSPQFIEQVKRLLETPRKTAPATRAAGAPASSPASRGGIPSWIWAAVVVVIGAVVTYIAMRPPGQASTPLAAPAKSAVAPVSAARQLVAKSAKLHDQLENATRGDLELAEQFCKQAIALDPNDAEAWAEYALVSCNYLAMG